MIWNVNAVYLDPKSLPSTKYKKNIPFFFTMDTYVDIMWKDP